MSKLFRRYEERYKDARVFTTGNVEKVIDLIKYTYRNILIFEIILKNRY